MRCPAIIYLFTDILNALMSIPSLSPSSLRRPSSFVTHRTRAFQMCCNSVRCDAKKTHMKRTNEMSIGAEEQRERGGCGNAEWMRKQIRKYLMEKVHPCMNAPLNKRKK